MIASDDRDRQAVDEMHRLLRAIPAAIAACACEAAIAHVDKVVEIAHELLAVGTSMRRGASGG
ncbi:hypothetical protein [Paraburkholderia mimosarum]|uniref:hypothetical protein n=1 Tax=Paraburkholderia mimosarum TaxID=312026 RepID=UPI0003FEAE2E|nr:hypothetical protein [Paraburkholderia mimosarum]